MPTIAAAAQEGSHAMTGCPRGHEPLLFGTRNGDMLRTWDFLRQGPPRDPPGPRPTARGPILSKQNLSRFAPGDAPAGQWHMCHSNRYAYVSHGNGPKAGTPLTIIVAYEFGMGLRPAPDGAGPVVSVRWGWQPFLEIRFLLNW